MSATQEDMVLQRLAVEDDIYWIGRKAVRLTFLSQQQRAMNLVWALHSKGKLTKGSKVAVVGAGLAGITAAFAAHQLDAEVTLFESRTVPLHLQRGCQLRFIHPHVLDWPDPLAESLVTDLPCLNWGAAMAARVCDVVMEEWLLVEASLKCYYGYEVRGLKKTASGQPLVFAEGGHTNVNIAFDVVILAIGFGLERTIKDMPLLSYWENDNFGRPVISGRVPRHYLVSGCGDGGLIDAIRLRLTAFDHSNFVFDLQHRPGLDDVKRRLMAIDEEVAEALKTDVALLQRIDDRLAARAIPSAASDELRRRFTEDETGLLIERKYRDLLIPEDLRKRLMSQLRQDTVVYLNGPNRSPFELKASVLNRFIVFLLCEFGGLRYRPGRVSMIVPVVHGYRVDCEHADFPVEAIVVDEVVVRHGPIPTIDRLFTREIAAACRSDAKALQDPTRHAMYPPDFLAKPALVARKQQVRLEYAMSLLPLAARSRFNVEEHDRVSVDVREIGVPRFVLSQRATARDGLKNSAPTRALNPELAWAEVRSL